MSGLQKKIEQYEDKIKRLTAQNEDFNTHIQRLTKQLETSQSRYSFSNPKTSEFTITDMKSPKSAGVNQSQSPLASTKSTAHPNSSGKRDYAISSELEYYFANAEYTRAAHLFAQLDYKKPASISIEKFSNWLTITNRLKDSQLSDIVNKLKLLIAFTAGQDVSTAEPSFFERDDLSAFEKIIVLLDERIPKALVKNSTLR